MPKEIFFRIRRIGSLKVKGCMIGRRWRLFSILSPLISHPSSKPTTVGGRLRGKENTPRERIEWRQPAVNIIHPDKDMQERSNVCLPLLVIISGM
jgi:hypothetical protein